MATTDADTAADAKHAHDHEHPKFLAHHFDTPEQQYDSGKLGMWVFLVTEVLFFSGMFCAYAIFRMLRPEVFEGCSQFLNTKLGAINTGVLLFSSLTMALAVRFSQTENHKGLVASLAATLSCAMMFLGVKAIEYSHKWEMGLLPAGMFSYDPAHPHIEDSPNYLLWICFPFIIALIGVVGWLAKAYLEKNEFQIAVLKPLTVVCLCFFFGVLLGMVLESGESGDSHSNDAVVSVEGDYDATQVTAVMDGASSDLSVLERMATDSANSGAKGELRAFEKQSSVASGSVQKRSVEVDAMINRSPDDFLTPSRAGVFFSIYYCMTGIHAIHILAGIAVLVWLLVRAVRLDFNRQYFGPVDYVGLYWHLVDLIWIYLFPLLYLIR